MPASRGKLSLAQALRCGVRYSTDGVVLGSGGFVDRFFEGRREGVRAEARELI